MIALRDCKVPSECKEAFYYQYYISRHLDSYSLNLMFKQHARESQNHLNDLTPSCSQATEIVSKSAA